MRTESEARRQSSAGFSDFSFLCSLTRATFPTMSSNQSVSGPKLGRVIAAGDELIKAGEDRVPVLAIGDPKPVVGCAQDFHAGLAGLDHFVHGRGNVEFGLRLAIVLAKEFGEFLLEPGKERR